MILSFFLYLKYIQSQRIKESDVFLFRNLTYFQNLFALFAQATFKHLWVMTSLATHGAARRAQSFTSRLGSITRLAMVRETRWAFS